MVMELPLTVELVDQAVVVVLAEQEALEIRHQHLRLKEIPEARELVPGTLEVAAAAGQVESVARLMQLMLAVAGLERLQALPAHR
jgi:hypothetical protein